MKYLITLLGLFVATGAWADNRIEVGNNTGGDHCHVQWNQDNADDEFKISCDANAEQDGDTGTYSAQVNGAFLKELGTLKAKLPKGPVFERVYKTNCLGTQGTIQDDDANAYTTNDCSTTVTFKQTPLIAPDVLITYRMVLRNAAAVKASAVDEAGTSVMFRQMMGYAEPVDAQ